MIFSRVISEKIISRKIGINLKFLTKVISLEEPQTDFKYHKLTEWMKYNHLSGFRTRKLASNIIEPGNIHDIILRKK